MLKNSKPDWIKVKALSEMSYKTIVSISHKYDLHTVCQEALCPNINECWSERTATFLLLGDICTRNCRFCSVKSSSSGNTPNPDEPYNIACAVKELNLKYVVLTSVDRDDLDDYGSTHFANTVNEIRKLNPDIILEVLIPDFNGNPASIINIIKSNPDIIAHNIETVRRLTPFIRDKRAGYEISLGVLKFIKELSTNIFTKSSLQLGFGESEQEIYETLNDLKKYDVDIVNIGQYLRPSKQQIPVQEYIHPEKFQVYKKYAEKSGFLYVASAPLVRSSYKAAKAFLKSRIKNQTLLPGL